MSTLSLRSILTSPVNPLAAVTRLTVWAERRRSRDALARLDAHLLADIGLEPQAATREAALPCWMS